MPREDSRTRAIRFLTEARVCILRVSTDDVFAVVRGDSGTVRWSRAGGWKCDCPAVGPCAHGRAVSAVVVVEQIPGRWVDLRADAPREARLATVVADPPERGVSAAN